MFPQPGYYSLVQFCPDRGRLEAVNVGVVLYCPGLDFLDVALADNGNHVRRVFGRGGVRPARLDAAKKELAHRLRSESYRPRSLDDFRHFIDTRANDLLLSPPRPMRVEQPQDDLAGLLRDLVERPRRGRARHARLAPELQHTFDELALAGLARRNVTTEVPVLGRRVRVPYAYRNGTLNLVKPHRFSAAEDAAGKAASQLATDGSLIARHGKEQDGEEKRLVVVATFAGNGEQADLRRRVLDVLREFEVKAVPPEGVAAFAEEVRREAHLMKGP